MSGYGHDLLCLRDQKGRSGRRRGREGLDVGHHARHQVEERVHDADRDLEGLAHISEIEMGEGEKIEEKFKVGDDLKVKVLKVDSIQHKIALSVKGV